jgi:hypothetical protein
MGGFNIPRPTGGSEIPNEDRVVDMMHIFVNVFRATTRPLMAEFGEEQAEEFVEELKFRIAAQSFGHQPLSPAYRRWKIRARLDPRILIATGEYLNSIMYRRIEDTPDNVVAYEVGVRDGIHGPSRLPYRVLARIHEFGAMRHGVPHVPARPHWRPMAALYRQRGNEIARQFRTRLAQRVRTGMQQ